LKQLFFTGRKYAGVLFKIIQETFFEWFKIVSIADRKSLP